MSDQTTALQCGKPRLQNTGPASCIEDLAAGWIGAPDLCPACTQAFMTALNGIAGPMTWHPNYRTRAER